MPRFYRHRDGCGWGYFQVLTEDPVLFFARGIQREDAPGLLVEEIMAEVKVFHYAQSHPLAGQVSRLEHRAAGRLWVASHE